MRLSRRVGLLLGLAAAVTFGMSTPFSKLLLEDARPQLLAGLLYSGAFLVLAGTAPLRRRTREAGLQVADLPRLGGLVLCGGILAPVLLLVGLERVSGTTGSLLLNLEGPLTLLIGLLIFREHIGRSAGLGAVAIFSGSALLSFAGPGGSSDSLGGMCIAAACLLWAVDNNLTQSLTLRDPFAIARVKTGASATVNLGLAVALGGRMPSLALVAGALALGAVAYGVSIVLDTYALRLLGAVREAAIFATAPFIGAVLAVPVLSETLTTTDVVASLVMAGGVALILSEHHDHAHEHLRVEHEHVHLHDEHHQHSHIPGAAVAEPHSHPHQHQGLVHSHPHVSDLHHRHPH